MRVWSVEHEYTDTVNDTAVALVGGYSSSSFITAQPSEGLPSSELVSMYA